MVLKIAKKIKKGKSRKNMIAAKKVESSG